MSKSKDIIGELRRLIVEAELEKVVPLLREFPQDQFLLLSSRIVTVLKDCAKGIISKPDEYIERARLAHDILASLRLYEDEQKISSSKVVSLNVQNVHLAPDDKKFINDIENQITMEQQSSSPKKGKSKIRTFYLFEGQISKYNAFIKVIDKIDYRNAQFCSEMSRLINQLGSEINQLCTLLDNSGKSNTPIYQDAKHTHEYAERIRIKLLEGIQNDNPIRIYKTIDDNELPQLRITLKELITKLEIKMKHAQKFSLN